LLTVALDARTPVRELAVLTAKSIGVALVRRADRPPGLVDEDVAARGDAG
jgi:hypothetical protein